MEFYKNGHYIHKIGFGRDLVFEVKPYRESALGWAHSILSHLTIYDELPLAELTEDDIVSRRRKLATVVSNAIEELHQEEFRMTRLLNKAGSSGGAPYVW
jgi:hypothetical protein